MSYLRMPQLLGDYLKRLACHLKIYFDVNCKILAIALDPICSKVLLAKNVQLFDVPEYVWTAPIRALQMS